MVHHILATDPADAYMKAIEHIISNGAQRNDSKWKELEVLDLVVEIKEPLEIDKDFFDNYSRTLDTKIYKDVIDKTLHSSKKGSYWQRLINWRGNWNQLQAITKRMRKYKHSRTLTAVLIDPEKDYQDFAFKTPCLTLIDFKCRDSKVNALAVFRGHDFGRKAYANYVALGELLKLICKKTGSKFTHGKLTVFSLSAFIRQNEIAKVKRLLAL